MSDGLPQSFFISYTAADVAWAEWIAVTLDQAGLEVKFQKWDHRPGGHFGHLMHRAAAETSHTIAVLSPRYLASRFGESEWQAAFVQDPDGERRRLIPVRIQECSPPGLLAGRIYIDLVGVGEDVARDLLLEGVRRGPGLRPSSARFPGEPVSSTTQVEIGPGYLGHHDSATGSLGGLFEPSALGIGGPPTSMDTRRAAPERTPWEWLNRKRPRIGQLLGEDADLVGHHEVSEHLATRLSESDSAELIVLTGPGGSGKSSLIRRLETPTESRVVDAGATAEMLGRPLRPDGSDIGRLLRELRPSIPSEELQVLFFDDIDHHLREAGIARFVHDAIGQLNLGLLVLTMSTALAPQMFPVPVTDLALDRRRAAAGEFDQFLDRVLVAASAGREDFDDELRRSLYELSEQTTDFRAVQYVVEMLVAYHQWAETVVRSADLRRLLEHDVGARRLPLPAVRAQRGHKLTFRRKDKSELLADVLLRHFKTPQDLSQAAAGGLDTFNSAAFLEEADQSFIEAVLSLCLTYSPRDLVLLLGPDDIQGEIDALHLDPGQLFAERDDKAHLLVRGLGFTLVEKPRGLADFIAAVKVAQGLLNDDEAPTKRVNAAGTAVSQHVKSALLDVLHFWASSLYGSVHNLVKAVNAARYADPPIDWRRLEARQIVELLGYLDRSAEDGASVYQLAFPGAESPVSQALLAACESFVGAEEEFRSARSSPSEEAVRVRCADLAAAAAEVLKAGESTFPAVIKLSEIVFDEYSRKIFRGVDSDDNEVRFALTADDREELVVAAHYFMLPRKRVSVNPHIVPRGGAAAPVLFDRAQAYDRASATQRGQAVRLLERVEFGPEDVVVDVGSGTGALAVEIGRQVRRVHGIDNSPAMVHEAEETAREAGLSNVTFEVADLREYGASLAFDLVLSNATMHWILPESRAYARLFSLLRPGGRLAVHQGGHGNYEGLHRFTRTLIADMKLGEYFHGWTYPIYYPTVQQYRELLEGVGFTGITIDSEQSDGSEYPNLLRDFSEAGLLPYLARLPEVQRESFRAEWLDEAEDGVTDRYAHRLYATATRP